MVTHNDVLFAVWLTEDRMLKDIRALPHSSDFSFLERFAESQRPWAAMLCEHVFIVHFSYSMLQIVYYESKPHFHSTFWLLQGSILIFVWIVFSFLFFFEHIDPSRKTSISWLMTKTKTISFHQHILLFFPLSDHRKSTVIFRSRLGTNFPLRK